MENEREILATTRELENLTNDQLIFRALSALVSHICPAEIYYFTLAFVLRAKAEENTNE